MTAKSVGNYRIVSGLGRGGMGEVFRAQDVRLGRHVALKFLPDRYLQDPTAVERFVREARAASALNHPNIVTIYDIGETDTGRFIAMELIEGRTLRAIAVQEEMAIKKLSEIGGQVAKALAVAHASGIVHRDIKPENIMVRDDGYVKVLDFGLALVAAPSDPENETRTSADTNPGMLLGTFRYMSPEQTRAEKATAASDIFSLGIVLYELATGRHPFPSDSQIGTLHAIASQAVVPASRVRAGIPESFEQLILRMLEKDARLRPSATEAAAALSALLQDAGSGEQKTAAVVVQRRLVGREKQLMEMHSAFDAAARGRGLMLAISGEPGIGKTTLVEDFFSELATRGVSFALGRGRCSERLAGTEAYLPVLEALESLLHSFPDATLIIKSVAPTWYIQIAPLSAEDSSLTRILADAKAASQERVKREFVALLQEVSRLRPLVLFFDDLQWADPSTVDLLSYVGAKYATSPLLLVGTYRPSQLLAGKHAFLQVKLELQGHGLCREMALGFLSRDDIDTYLALEFPENRFPPELPELIHLKTEGSPLFMADLVRYLRDRGVIAEENGRWALVRALPDIDRDLPESVRSMIQSKIDQLSDADRRLLAGASVQGHEFDTAVVAKSLGMDPAEVEERLEILDRVHTFVHLIGERELPDATLSLRYCFVHVLYQNSLYTGVTATRKAALSAAIAQALLGFHGERSSEIAAELALLFEMARDYARAADYFVMAARNAWAVRASQETIGLLQRAIANAEKLRDEARHARVHNTAIQLARLYETLRRVSDAVAAYDVAEKAAAANHDVDGQIQAICGRGNALLFFAKDMEGCHEQIRRASELAQGHPSTESTAAVEMVRYLDRVCAGDFDAALQAWDRALPILREKGLSPANLLGLTLRGGLYNWRSEYDESDWVLDWALEKAREVGDLPRILQNHFVRGMSLGRRGRFGEALEVLHEAQRLAELTGERVQFARLPNTIGWLHRELQDLEGALELDLEGIRLTQGLGDTESEINSRINAGQVYLLLGEPARAYEHLEQAETLLKPFQWFNWLFKARLEAELASYWIARGDTQRAARHASAVIEITERSLVWKYMAWARRLLGDIALMEDRAADAGREYDSALAILAGHPCPPVEWIVRKAVANLARRLKNDALADEQACRARAVVASLASSVPDEKLRQTFLMSRAVREL